MILASLLAVGGSAVATAETEGLEGVATEDLVGTKAEETIDLVNVEEAMTDWVKFDDNTDKTFGENTETTVDLVGCVEPCDGCDGGCAGCCEPCYCPPWWAHRTGVFGQYLLLRPGDTDLVYTIEQNNLPANEFPTGPMGIAQIEHSSGVRAGFTCCATECTSLVGSLTYWEGDDTSTIDRVGTNILVSEVLHPSRLNAGAAGLQERADYTMRFGLADLAYRHLWKRSDKQALNWRAGFQYAGMEEQFSWEQTVPSSVAVGTFTVDTDIDFTGFGLLAGIDYERRSCRTGISCYGNVIGSALAGKWQASYADTAAVLGGVIANTYDDFRVTPIVELELGLAWSSKCGRFRVNTGYMTSAWYNSVSSRAYIDAVREGRYVDVDETITFSGLVVGGEFNF